MSKEAYYFSHDANARHDPKILALRSEYGVKGYGIYWIIIEMLREQEGYKLPLKKYIFNAIAMQVQCKDFAKEDAKVFVEDCINEFELFVSDAEFFWSNSLLKRMGKKQDLSEKRRAAAKARWEKASDSNDSVKKDEQNNASAMQMHANAMQDDARKGKESKRKESKVKEIKEKETVVTEAAETLPPAINENAVFEFYTKNLQKGVSESPFVYENISHWIKDLTAEIVLEAMKESAVRENKGFAYTEGILKSWANEKVKNLEDIKRLKDQRQKQAKRTGYGRGRKEVVPEYMEEQRQETPVTEAEQANVDKERERLQEKLRRYRESES